MRNELFVEQWGRGAPVLLAHGLGASCRYWEPLRAALPDGHRGTAPDLLGFGKSPKPDDATYDVDLHISTLVALTEPGSIVVGHSAGAILAAALAARRPDLVSALVLVGLPAFPDEATAMREIGRLGRLARLTVDESPWARRICGLMCEFRPVSIALAPLLVRDVPPRVARDGPRHTWPSYSRTLRHVVVEHRVDADLEAFRGPVILVHGRADAVAPLAYVRNLVESKPAVELRVIAGDHHIAIRAPSTIVAAVVDVAA